MAAKARRSPALRRLSPIPTNTPRAASATGIAGSSDSRHAADRSPRPEGPSALPRRTISAAGIAPGARANRVLCAEPCRLAVRSSFQRGHLVGRAPGKRDEQRTLAWGRERLPDLCGGRGVGTIHPANHVARTKAAPIAGSTGINANDFGADSRQRRSVRPSEAGSLAGAGGRDHRHVAPAARVTNTDDECLVGAEARYLYIPVVGGRYHRAVCCLDDIAGDEHASRGTGGSTHVTISPPAAPVAFISDEVSGCTSMPTYARVGVADRADDRPRPARSRPGPARARRRGRRRDRRPPHRQ